jgi:hypothetical protein
VNTYTKTHPTPSDNQEDIDMVGEIFKSHISKLIAEPEYQTVLLDFLAHNVQLPGHKIRWAVLIQGGEGCGKGLLAQVLRTVMGEKHVASVDPEVLSSPYNDWAYGHALSVLNEIHSKGMSRYAVENKLKEPIADDKVSINQKFRDHRQINNRTNYIMFTNYHDALAISPNSRRYFVLQSPLQRKKDILALTETGHFDKVFGMVKEYPRALRAWFEQYKISDGFCADGPPPVTSYLKDMQQVTKPEAEQEFERILIDGDHAMVQRDLISSTTMLNVLNSELSKPTSGKHLASLLMAEGYKQHNVRITSGGVRHRMWVSEDADEIQAMNSKQLTELVRVRVEGVLDEDLESLG